MIKLEFQNKIYTVDDDYKISPQEDILQGLIDIACMEYGYPSQGFKTGFVVQQLKDRGIEIIEFYDIDMEEAPDGIIY